MGGLRDLAVRDWERLLSVLRHRSYPLAAQECCCSAQTVKDSITKLEDAYGVPFVSRGGKNTLRVTWQAHLTAETWRQVRQKLDQSFDEIRLPEGLWGLLRVGCQVGHWANFIDRAVSELSPNAPGARIRVNIHTYNTLVEKLEKGKLDLAVLYDTPPTLAECTGRLLGDETLMMFSSKAPVHLCAETLKAFVHIDWGKHFEAQVMPYLTQLNGGIRPPFGLEINDGSSALAHFDAHFALGYFPRRMVQSMVDQGRLFAVAGAEGFTRQAWLLGNTDILESSPLSEAEYREAVAAIAVAPDQFSHRNRGNLNDALKHVFCYRLLALQGNIH